MTIIGIAFNWSGIAVVIVSVVGFILAIIKLIINVTNKEQKETSKQLDNLTQEVKLDLKGA